MAQVELQTRTQTITRTEYLGRFVEDLARRLSGHWGPYYAQIISKGVIQRQYIATLFVSYLKGRELVGKVELHIDYLRHRVNIDRHGERFAFDIDSPVAAQASPGLEQFIAVFAKLINVRGVSVELSWYWSSGIDVEEARQWMGSAAAEVHQWRQGDLSTVGSGAHPRAALEELDRRMEGGRRPATAEINHRPGGLDEVQLTGQIVLEALADRREGENNGE